jgi:hypothetical protein
MTRKEYERRKQQLADQLREGVALLEQGYQRQLRALELIWMADANGGAIPSGQDSLEAAAPAGPVKPPGRYRLASGQLVEDVRRALSQMPEVFDRNDLLRTFDYEPERSSLHRVLASLVREGVLVLSSHGTGKIPAKYRKAGS